METIDSYSSANKEQAARILALERALELAALRFHELCIGSYKRSTFCATARDDARATARSSGAAGEV
jgi:hypothetical protein